MTAGDVVEVVVDTVDIADASCQLASVADVLPDCAILDCAPGCL